VRIFRIEFQELREQHGRDIGHAHRHAGMSRLRGFDSVDRKRADGVGHVAVRNGGGLGTGHEHPDIGPTPQGPPAQRWASAETLKREAWEKASGHWPDPSPPVNPAKPRNSAAFGEEPMQ
jgi:hypothetical protein